MDANEYQRQALLTEPEPPPIMLNENREHPEALSRLMHGAMGVATESGELIDQLKKHLIYGKQFNPTNVLEEAGDLLWYVALSLDAMGFTMGEAMERNLAKLRKRYPNRFEADKALNRDLDAERKTLEE